MQAQLLDLNQRLTEVNKLLTPLMGDDVGSALLRRSATAVVEVDGCQLDQVVIHLAVNACDAMPHGGRSIIETGIFDFDDAFTREHPAMTAGRCVMMAISDNGVGMDEVTRSRIFEPFFTTKKWERGPGWDWPRSAPGGCSLHSSQDFRQSEGPAFSVSQSGEEKVHVIGHDHYSVKMNRLAVVVAAMLHRKCTSFGRESSCGLRAEGYE